MITELAVQLLPFTMHKSWRKWKQGIKYQVKEIQEHDFSTQANKI